MEKFYLKYINKGLNSFAFDFRLKKSFIFLDIIPAIYEA